MMISQYFESRFQDWVKRRLPPAKNITLNQRRIFIFPSRAGFGFLLLLLLMLLAAINYQNNMIFALVFLLASMFVVTIVHSFANVSGLSIQVLQARPAFVGERVQFNIKVRAPSHSPYFDIQLRSEDMAALSFSLVHQPEQQLALHWWADHRGRFKPPKILLESFYPLGLLRTWSWIRLDMEALIYPQPLEGVYRNDQGSDLAQGELIRRNGSAEFYGLKTYQAGDNPRQIAWRNYAKSGQLYSKEFGDYQDQQQWLDWQGVNGSIEQRLSLLCYWALQLESQQQVYGLRLPGQTIQPASGMAHQRQVLKALALFNGGEQRG
jgi:uncharacterized protein (DUF58 family)